MYGYTASKAVRLLLREVLQQDVSLLRVSTPVLDNNTRAANNLSGVTFSVQLAQTGPLTQQLGVGNLDQWDLFITLVTQSLNQLDNGSLGNRVTQDTQLSLLSGQSLGSFSQTSGQTIVDQRGSQDNLQSVFDGDGSILLLNGNFFDNLLFFDVRHFFYGLLRQVTAQWGKKKDLRPWVEFFQSARERMAVCAGGDVAWDPLGRVPCVTCVLHQNIPPTDSKRDTPFRPFVIVCILNVWMCTRAVLECVLIVYLCIYSCRFSSLLLRIA
ncbi:hypothetical protein FOB63_003990 [Clavispora lusitaniae]|uniref:uncharacterized protein n=1 Tax=Clavispora lusitaniae TaxID=36911 RepID=UPI00202C0ACD|nr:hypothetical protein FOB63_003990 [Clavispora lusitaniae]